MVSIDEFKKAFAGQHSDDLLAVSDQKVAATLKQLKLTLSHSQPGEQSDQYQRSLAGLVQSYADARKLDGRPVHEIHRQFKTILKLAGDLSAECEKQVGPSSISKSANPVHSLHTAQEQNPASAEGVPSGKTLSSGSRGSAVKELQVSLNKVIGARLNPDGCFGSKTKDAVVLFQKRRGLKVDGVVGPKTWQALAGSLGSNTKGGPSDGDADARIDAATYPGFSAWLHPAIRAADDACINAERTSNRLGTPYQGRMQRLIRGVVDLRNLIDNQAAALAEGQPAPELSANARRLATQLEERVQTLTDVTEAWDAVYRSGVFELLAQFNEARVRRAESLRDELQACHQELRRLRRIAEGTEMAEAFAQTGLDAAIAGAEAAITVVNPIAGVAIAVGAAATQLTLDALLGPSGPGLDAFSGSGASVAGSVLENLPKATDAMKRAGKRLGIAANVVGTISDVLETQEAIRRYEEARGQIRALSSRLERIASELDSLRPILASPELTQRLIAGMRDHAAVLREQGQIALQGV